MKTRAYQAYAAGGFRVTEETPRQAAVAFFARFPDKRKCSVIQGEVEGACFTVVYGRASEGQWPSSWKDVTKKTAPTLPDTEILK